MKMKKWIIAFACLFVVRVHAQENITLHIGDAAPGIQYSQWIKGTPINSFKGDQLFILEFWATWCGPCKAAMPHLTELQKQYEGKANFIGVNIWEKVKKGQPYESSLPMVTKFVNSNSANMGYNVIADNNEQYMGNSWMKAAGMGGIPCTFVIQNEKIVWIGHPMQLDSILPKILNGSYNMAEFKLRLEKGLLERQNDPMTIFGKTLSETMKAKEYKKALALMDKFMDEHSTNKDYKSLVSFRKFELLIEHFSQEEAISFANAAIKDKDSSLWAGHVVAILGLTEGLAKTTYLWAAKHYANAPQTQKEHDWPRLISALAYSYARGGDYKNAIIAQQKAIKDAEICIKKGWYPADMNDATVTKYKENLAKYKKGSHKGIKLL